MEEGRNQPYQHVISLGTTCQPAWHMRLNNIRLASYPLDWIAVPFDVMYTLLETDFRDYFEKAYLQPKGKHPLGKLEVQHTKFGISFIHEFKNEKRFKKDYPEVKKTVERRIARLYEVLNSELQVLFVRRECSREEAVALTGLLNRKFPNLKYDMLVIDETEEIRQDWQIPNVINRYMETASNDDANDPAYNENWTRLFSQFTFDFSSKPRVSIASEEEDSFPY